MEVKYLRKLMLFGITALCLSILAIPARAQVKVKVKIQLPPLIVFSAPPEVIVLPETYVYVIPDIEEDVYYCDGYWWRPWGGHWYRSRKYDEGWAYYKDEPTFYREVPQDWRHEYRNHQWRGQPWNHQRIQHQQVQRNWNGWKRNRHWERQNTWGVQGLKPRPGHQGQPPHAQPPGHQGQPPHAGPPGHQGGQPPHAQPPGHQGQPPHAGPPGHQGGQPPHVGPPQGNQGQGQGNKAKKHDKKDKKNKKKEKVQ